MQGLYVAYDHLLEVQLYGQTKVHDARGVKKNNNKNGRSWLARFETPKCTFLFFPFSYISDPMKLIEYMFGTVG